jgi:UDPglucose 6-dehydrogenase
MEAVKVRAYDPHVKFDLTGGGRFEQMDFALEACQGADVLVVMTAWKEFGDVDLKDVASRLRGRVIVDPFGVLNEKKCLDLRFRYHRLGTRVRE